MTTPVDPLVEVARVEGARILAVLARATGDLQRAEDAVQDALVAALEVWPRTGPPRDPAAWLYTAARRKALDVMRREGRRADKEAGAAAWSGDLDPVPPPVSVVRDDQLALVFACCHPALDLDARVALALRTLCGLSTADVARALLVSEPTMAKRLVRAKAKIAHAGIAFRLPVAEDLPARLAAVGAVVHLVYTAGHSASGPVLVRADLCDESIRLARLLVELVPDDPLPEALLALLLLTDSRRSARVDAAGDVVLLADQDRARWDRAAIEEGVALLECSLARTDQLADPYQLQAAIAAVHATAPSYGATDWPEIVRLYGLLAEVHPNPVVDLNAAVAVGEAHGPVAGLRELDAVAEGARGYLWFGARAEMLVRLGDVAAARDAFAVAASQAPSAPERRHLDKRMATVASQRRRGGAIGAVSVRPG